jgi:hypothetical protein
MGLVFPPAQLIANSTLAAIYGIRYGVQVAALNNSYYAKNRAHNPICLRTSKNIVNERTAKSRSTGGRVIAYSLSAASGLASVGVACTGIGVVSIPIISSVGNFVMACTHLGASIYEHLYNRRTERLRAKITATGFDADWKQMPKPSDVDDDGNPLYTSREQFIAARNAFLEQHSKGRQNMGWTERAMIRMLRSNHLSLRTEAIEYLKDLGFSKEMITYLIVEEREQVAINALIGNLYANRLKHNWAANRYLHRSLADTMFIGGACRRVVKLHERRRAQSAARVIRTNALPTAF